MIINILPKIETHEDLFFNYKQDNEFLGIASFTLKDYMVDK